MDLDDAEVRDLNWRTADDWCLTEWYPRGIFRKNVDQGEPDRGSP
jgi:hypothetical protein